MSEQLSLFGPPEGLSGVAVKEKKALDTPPGDFAPQSHAQACHKFRDYEGFVEKFAPKKTTDDCYTPGPVYDAVLGWLRARVDLEGRPILRPFFPGGDFERSDYPPGCVVIDNPPFSILRRILTFYVSRGIDFFLFGPELTLFQRGLEGITYIIQGNRITYENGARIPTGFISSLFPGRRCILSGTLSDAIDAAQQAQKKPSLPILNIPPEVVTSAGLRTYIVPGEDIEIARAEMGPKIDSFGGRRIYGGGRLVAPAVAERLRAARLRREEERRRREEERRRREEERRVCLTPTPEEAAMIRAFAQTDGSPG